MFRFLFDRDGFTVVVEFYDTESLRIIYIVSEYSSAFAGFCILYSSLKSLLQSMSCENVITQHHGNCVIADEFLADDKCLRKSVRAWLYGIGKMNAELMSVTQKFLETRGILWCGDDQDIADACIHQYRHWIVDHRFVVDRQKLFGSYHCQRIKACAGTTC